MYKYILCIIIGIIFFWIHNRKETFNIGGKSIGDQCDHINDPPDICNISDQFDNCTPLNVCKCSDGSGGVEVDRCVLDTELNCETHSDCSDQVNCNGNCYCYFNKCKIIEDSGDLDYKLDEYNVCAATTANRPTHINMLSNTDNSYFGDDCIIDDDCTSDTVVRDIKDVEKESCNLRGFDRENCLNTHQTNRSGSICSQICPMKTKTNNSKDLVNAGFEHVELLDLTDTIDQDFHYNLEYGGRLAPYNNINSTEYHFFKFLEKKFKTRAKKIRNGIVYINSRIFYYTLTSNVPRYSESPNISDAVREEIRVDKFNYMISGEIYANPFLALHIDFNNFRRWRVGDDTDWGITTPKTTEFTNEMHVVIDSDTYSENIMKTNTLYLPPEGNQLDLYKTLSNKLTHINIWVKLTGSENFNSLGLLDMVEDAKLVGGSTPIQNFKNALVSQISTDEGDLKKTRINQFSDQNGIFINTNNYDMPYYNVDLDNLYTYNMKNGNALVFNTVGTPHTALKLKDEDEWRLTSESRYAYMNKPFDINRVFTLSSDGTEIIREPSYNDNISIFMDDPTNSYDELTRGTGFFSIDDVKSIFIQRYDTLEILYIDARESLGEQIKPFFVEYFNVHIFKYLMDSVRFEYFNDDLKLLEDIKNLIRID